MIFHLAHICKVLYRTVSWLEGTTGVFQSHYWPLSGIRIQQRETFQKEHPGVVKEMSFHAAHLFCCWVLLLDTASYSYVHFEVNEQNCMHIFRVANTVVNPIMNYISKIINGCYKPSPNGRFIIGLLTWYANTAWNAHLLRLPYTLDPPSAAQNYGFIASDSGGPDIFVHKRNVRRDEEGKPGPLRGFKDGSAFS
jgi:hypothetical protein